MFRPRAPRRMAAGAALVLALHALLALLLPPPRPDPPATGPSVPALVWLRPVPPADAPPPARPPPAARTAAAPRMAAAPGRTGPAPRLPAREAQAITLPAPAAPPADAPVAAPARPATAERLNLALPRGASAPWRARHPALDDPRLARERRTLETAIAAALGGDDRVVEERLDADRVRVRSGSRCVLLKRSRAGQLDLAGGALRDLWAASEC